MLCRCFVLLIQLYWEDFSVQEVCRSHKDHLEIFAVTYMVPFAGCARFCVSSWYVFTAEPHTFSWRPVIASWRTDLIWKCSSVASNIHASLLRKQSSSFVFLYLCHLYLVKRWVLWVLAQKPMWYYALRWCGQNAWWDSSPDLGFEQPSRFGILPPLPGHQVDMRCRAATLRRSWVRTAI